MLDTLSQTLSAMSPKAAVTVVFLSLSGAGGGGYYHLNYKIDANNQLLIDAIERMEANQGEMYEAVKDIQKTTHEIEKDVVILETKLELTHDTATLIVD